MTDRPITLSFHGAAGTVTGSSFLLDTGQARVLIDCGMFQGAKSEKELNYLPFPFEVGSLDAVLLTHAHIDHSGLLPKLVRAGFERPIFATRQTVDLAGVMLPDSAHIQEIEVEHLNRRSRRRGRKTVEPIYTLTDAIACQALFKGVGYQEAIDVAPGIVARFWNAGHLLGSASIELTIASEAEPLRILFSGDIGGNAKLLQPEPGGPAGLDYVICESTYGGTDRGPVSDKSRRDALCKEVLAARSAGGALLIPSFAVERTQEVLTDLALLIASGALPRIQIHIDSPLATRATQVFAQHAAELDHGSDLLAALKSPDVHFTESVEDSIALDTITDFHIVISASGMCDAGRIRHRLKNWLWNERATVLMVGFQAQGTLGRILLDGAKEVRIQGDEIVVRARIRTLDLYSGHADGAELVQWLRDREPIRRGLFLVHGEPESLLALKDRVASLLPADRVIIPEIDSCFALTRSGAQPYGTPRRRIEPAHVAHLDWHNDLSRLLLDINQAVDHAADERSRSVIIRALRRALDDRT